MRRILGGVAAATLALTAVPALAVDEPALLAPCAAAGTTPVLTLDKGVEDAAVATPQLPGDESTLTVLLDLAGQPVGTTASVATVVSWGLPVNDYDVTTSGGGDSANFNVDQTAPSEEAVGSGIGHCDRFTVTVSNFAAPVVVDTITAALTATAEETFEE